MTMNYNEMISNIIDNFDYDKVLGPVNFYEIDGNKLECKVEGDWKHAHKNFKINFAIKLTNLVMI